MKSMLKSEIADKAGVSLRTLSRWLKTRQEELTVLGAPPRSKLLPPCAVKYICDEYGIDL